MAVDMGGEPGGDEGPTEIGPGLNQEFPYDPGQDRMISRLLKATRSPVAKAAVAAIAVGSFVAALAGGPVVLAALLPATVFFGTWRLEGYAGITAGIARRRLAKQERKKHPGQAELAAREHALAAHEARQRQAREERATPAPEPAQPATAEMPPATPSEPVAPVVRPGQDPATVRGTTEAGHAAALADVLRRVADPATPPSPELRKDLRAAILAHYSPNSASERVRDFGNALLQAGAAASPEAGRRVAMDALTAHGVGSARPAAPRRPAAVVQELG